MTLRFGLQFALLLPLTIGACGSSCSSASGVGGPGGAAGAGAAVSSGGKSAQSGTAGSTSGLGQGGSTGLNGDAGGSADAAGASAALATPTWNSARSATLSDEQLQSEYAAWKGAYTEACSNGSMVVLNDGAVVSEGIAYGMLLAASMADQPLFDGLWKYYEDHLDDLGLMNSATAECEAPGNNDSHAATDADLDAAMSLIQAAARWPSAGYLPQAQILTSKISTLESELCSGRRVLRPGDAYGGCSDASDDRINPSYFAPGYYKVFAHYFPDQAATWTALADGSYQLYAIYQARMQNLVPDWSGPDGSDNGSGYSSYACRTPWRVAVDYGWSGDTRAKTFMENICTWVDANGGLPQAAQMQNSAYIGAFALAGAYEQGKFDGYMSSWLGAKVDDTPYLPGTLRVLYLLVAAGKFSSTM